MRIFSSDRPIVLVGAVTDHSVKIFVAEKLDFVHIPSISGAINYHIRDLSRDGYNIHIFTIDGLYSDRKYIFNIMTSKGTREIKVITDNVWENSINFLVGSCNLHSLGFINNPNKPFETINRIVERQNMDFMLHLGDQIYADIPNPFFRPTFKHYAECYFDAWADSRETNELLCKIPNYMSIDDHEIVDNYANKKDKTKYKKGIEAYGVFQHSHNPVSEFPDAYHYRFNKGIYPFFVMDTRLERNRDRNLMISERQENSLYSWLTANSSSPFKFICTSVPFLSHLHRTEHDKWTSHYFNKQRLRILKFIADRKIKNVIFLSADVHCSMVTSSDIFTEDGNIIKVSEIVSSPINQIQKGFKDEFKHHVIENLDSDIRMYTEIDRIYTEASNVVSISVNNNKLNWRLYRTRKNRLELEGTIHAAI